jgi:hypothetical protein
MAEKYKEGMSVEQKLGLFSDEFFEAKRILNASDDELKWVPHDYQLFVFVADGIRLVFYPHTTRSTGHQSVRIRSETRPELKTVAEWLMTRLYTKTYGVTFSSKGRQGVRYG